MTRLPHFSLPFRFEGLRGGRESRIPVNEQDTAAEIADCAELSLRTEQGDRSRLPPFGRPRHLAFLTDREMLRAAIQATLDEDEPRAQAYVQRRDIDRSDDGVQRLIAMLQIERPEELGPEEVDNR